MKKFFGKKMALTIIAGVLTTAIAVGGIFAWFTSTQKVDTGTFTTAQVKLLVNDQKSYVWNFYPGHDITIDAQRALEDGVKEAGHTPQERSNNLAAWWLANKDDFNCVTPDTTPPVAFDSTKINFILAPTKMLDACTYHLITPGSFIYREYNFISDSNIPVYFRIKAPVITNETSAITPIYAAYINILDDTVLLTQGSDGYLYSLTPFKPTEDIKVLLTAYLSGTDNSNALQNTTITFGATGAELIQATNNAVYLSDWAKKDINGVDLVFKTYLDLIP